jgi:hypothetical protein
LTKFCTQDRFEEITKENVRYDEFQKYFHVYFDEDTGAKKYSSELTAKDNKESPPQSSGILKISP